MTNHAMPTRRDILHAAAATGAIAGVPALAAGEPPPATKRIKNR